MISDSKTKKLLFIVNTDWFFLSHRLPIAKEALNQGYEVHIATTISDKLIVLRNNGLIVHPLNLHRSNVKIFRLVSEFREILSIMRKVKPDVVHLVTIKPVLLGGIAARLASIPAALFAVSGLGFVFIDRGISAKFRRQAISLLYHFAFRHKNKRVIFQNTDDQSILSNLSKLSLSESVLIPGSGVDLSVYHNQPYPKGLPVVLFAARLLEDKGIREFVQAAKLVNSSGNCARFIIAGEPDLLNPATIQQEEFDQWQKEGVVELLGYCEDMIEILALSTIVVLPSYREGFPKILIEAAACGRAIITTDVPGCRDAIEDGITGFLVPVRDYKALAEKIYNLLDNPLLCRKMGKAGRSRAEEVFDVNKVVAKHIEIYAELLGRVKT